jgi:hypothetical protein
MRLADYPYVMVRIRCDGCQREGRYRPAKLAAKYGADFQVPDLIGKVASECPAWKLKHSLYERCKAYFPDLGSPKATF